METNAIHQQLNAQVEQIISSEALLEHWQGHRRLTRKTIEAFPEDKIFSYSIGGMRPMADLVSEIMDLSKDGINGIVTGEWKLVAELDHAIEKSNFETKTQILQQWDQITAHINQLWFQISESRFHEVDLAFGAYEGKIIDLLLYFIDNEIHHRAQSYVYLRSLGVEPPAFWNRW
jgi:uncharacterized damage-inducible protein DinB